MRRVREKIDESAWEIVMDDSAECQIIANLHSNYSRHPKIGILGTQGVIKAFTGGSLLQSLSWEHPGELWERGRDPGDIFHKGVFTSILLDEG